MNNFNNEDESVHDTLNRVMTDMGYFSNPVTITTPVGSRTFYEPANTTATIPNHQHRGSFGTTANSTWNDVKDFAADVWDTTKTMANNFATGAEASVAGYTAGATLGNFDEGMGAATAAVTLNSDNYTMGRDATRQLQKDLQQRHPYVYGASEIAGATQASTFISPFLAPVVAGIGYAENMSDIPKNIGKNILASRATRGIQKLNSLPQKGRDFIQNGLINYLLQDSE